MLVQIFLNQFLMGLKLYVRRPAAMFWMMAFPVLMLMGLGTVFSGSSDNIVRLVWSQQADASAQDLSLQQSLKELGVALEQVTPEQAEQRWQSGKLPVMLEKADDHYSLRVNSYLAGQGMSIVALVQQAFLMVQARALGAGELARIPLLMQSPGGHHDGPYAAYLLPGLLGLNLLMMGVFSVGMVDVDLRVKGIYKRLATTPLPPRIYLGAQMAVRLVVVVVAASVLMGIGALMFGIQNQGSYISLFALLFLGTACFASLGYLLASFAGTVEAANGLANLFFLPLMMLSGVYFSLDAAPVWLQKVSDYTPLTPLLKALRAVFNDGAHLSTQGTPILIMAVWTLLLFVFASKRFKWV
ncbi:ABC-2 type transport system permease protein [Oxalobacteraceae bacterium GrIS 2.11]